MFPQHWAVVSLKMHEVKKRLAIFVCTYSNGETKISRQSIVPSMGIEDTNLMYLHGLSMAIKEVPGLSNTVVYVNGHASDEFLDKCSEGAPALGITFEKTHPDFYKTMIASCGDLPRDRRLAMSTASDTYINPNHPTKVAESITTLHVFTDGSKARKSKTKGYGLGYAVRNLADNTVETFSGWEQSVTHYNSNQFEFAGMLRAMDDIAAKHYKAWHTGKLNVVVHCDNQHAVNMFNTYMSATVAQRRKMILDFLHDGKINTAKGWVMNRNVNVKAVWVKGHSGNVLNETSDQLAVNARRAREGAPVRVLRTEKLSEPTGAAATAL